MAVRFDSENEAPDYYQSLETLRPEDEVRGAFIGNVVAPLTHHELAIVADQGSALLLHSLGFTRRFRTADMLTEAAEQADLNTEALGGLMLGYVGAHFIHAVPSHAHALYSLPYTSAQRRAAKRYTVEGPLKAAATIPRVVSDIIAPRHPEIGLDEPDGMSAFLRDERTPAVLRGMMTGGSGFIDGIRGRNRHPTQAWRDNPEKPVLEQNRGLWVPTEEFFKAAVAHRRAVAMADVASLRDNGLLMLSMRTSSGCPMRWLRFRQDEPQLVAAGLALTDEQCELLTAGSQPVARPLATEAGGRAGQNHYRVIRDGLAEMCGILATGVKVLSGGS